MQRIRIKLDKTEGVNISRSKARNILFGVEKFNTVIIDYDCISVIGQAFADEIYRVFKNKYPTIIIQEENMSEGVKFMVERAKHEALILQS